jgi:thiosulfate/3-mercaptopyruvate sulfurtransferase
MSIVTITLYGTFGDSIGGSMQLRQIVYTIALIATLAISGCSAEDLANRVAAFVEMTEYAKPDVLVDTQWVAGHLEDPTVRLIDVSGQQEDYQAGHLPGAVYVNVVDDLTHPDDPVRSQILTQEALSALLSRLGVHNDDTVVFYDNTNNLFAASAYWALKYYQHADVRVYNGGVKKWLADGQQLTGETPTVTPGEYVAKEADLAIRTTADYVLEHIDDANTLLCDVRSPDEYSGADVRSARGGHIPGAINVEWTNAVNDDGTFKDAATLNDLYTRAGFARDKEIITYCQTGIRGAHTWFVLHELLGFPDVRNYDGSWEEYGNRDDVPIES